MFKARVLMSTLAIISTSAAHASGGACPAAFDTADCDVGGTDVCTSTADPTGDTLYCDLQLAPSDSTATLVEGYSGGGKYAAWGWYGTTKYCCQYTSSVVGYVDIKIHGSEYADTLRFNHINTYDLRATGLDLDGGIDGDIGNDTIVGSNVNSSKYTESLLGYTGNDTINGGGGDDTIDGGDDDDTLLGGPGEDDIHGGAGEDSILGGDDQDYLDGDSGDDAISGGSGSDYLDTRVGGDVGTDVLCGEGQNDHLYSDAGSGDKLWGPNVGDDVRCDDATVMTDMNSSPSGPCTRTLTTRPACP
jgi:hypothetical protein